MTRALLLMLVACAPKSPTPALPVPAEILPEEGSICESERGVALSELEAPTYRVYSLEELRRGFPAEAQFRFVHSPMDLPTPRPAFVEEWAVESVDTDGLTVLVKTGPSVASLAVATPEQRTMTWDEWGGQWTFPAAEIEIKEASCTDAEGQSIPGLQIRQSKSTVSLERVFEYCFATAGAMPPVSLKIQDFGELKGSSTLSILSLP
jgi:hypothetical protein